MAASGCESVMQFLEKGRLNLACTKAVHINGVLQWFTVAFNGN